jgi:uncharacterized protein YodC (DUF2158 family)
MVTSQWLLKRVAESEQKIYLDVAFGEQQYRHGGLAKLERHSRLKTRRFRPCRFVLPDRRQTPPATQRAQPRATKRQQSPFHVEHECTILNIGEKQMAGRKFKDGDVVRQKSGVVNLVVAGYNERGQVVCTFDEEQLDPAGPERPKQRIGPRQTRMRTSSGF